jgi:hypothetical protein
MTPDEYEEIHVRAALKVGIAFGVPALGAAIAFWSVTYPYLLAICGIGVWGVFIDRAVDRIRDRCSKKLKESASE